MFKKGLPLVKGRPFFVPSPENQKDNQMNITLNGKTIKLEQNTNLLELLQNKNVEIEKIVIEYNREIIKREMWKNIILKENDNLEVLKFVGGG